MSFRNRSSCLTKQLVLMTKVYVKCFARGTSMKCFVFPQRVRFSQLYGFPPFENYCSVVMCYFLLNMNRADMLTNSANLSCGFPLACMHKNMRTSVSPPVFPCNGTSFTLIIHQFTIWHQEKRSNNHEVGSSTLYTCLCLW